MLIKILIWILKNKKTFQSDKELIFEFLMGKIQALPTKDLISFDSTGTILIANKPLEADQAILLRENAVSLGKNGAYRTIKEQIAFEAIQIGIHKAQNSDQLVFAKAALWIQQREMEIIAKLANDKELFDTFNQ